MCKRKRAGMQSERMRGLIGADTGKEVGMQAADGKSLLEGVCLTALCGCGWVPARQQAGYTGRARKVVATCT